MNTDVEELLREGMERFTRDLRAPAGMAHQVARQRRLQLARRSVAAALAAGAVALVAVVVPGARENGTGGRVVDTAYVVKRVDSALSAAEPGEIAQMTVTTRGAIPGGATVTKTDEVWSYGGQWRSVTTSPAGHPVYDEGISTASGYTVVSYRTRTWARQPGWRTALPSLGPLAGMIRPKAAVLVPRGCGPMVGAVPLLFRPGLPGIGFSASSLPAAKALRTAISCGTLAVAGRQRVDGIETVELTSRPDSPISETIWVTPGTYLPVRMVVRSAPGAPALRQTADITWLPPTAQNLAKLIVPIPAGFRRVPFAMAVRPILQQIPGWPKLGPLVVCLGPAGPPTCKGGTGASGSGAKHGDQP